MDGKVTEAFPINQGVRQGCVLSPLLFNIFMADLAKNLSSLEEGFATGNAIQYSGLMTKTALQRRESTK